MNISFKPGDLIKVIKEHRVPVEKTQYYARFFVKGVWPYNTSDDLLIPKEQICFVLKNIESWVTFDLYYIKVLLINQNYEYGIHNINPLFCEKI